jgi:hypothetical protein
MDMVPSNNLESLIAVVSLAVSVVATIATICIPIRSLRESCSSTAW